MTPTSNIFYNCIFIFKIKQINKANKQNTLMSMLNMKMINTLFRVNVCVSKLKHEKICYIGTSHACKFPFDEGLSRRTKTPVWA